MRDQGEYEKAYNLAIKALSARLLTVGELHEKLRKKAFSQQVIVELIRNLETLDFLNDARYAQIFVENLKRYKDFGYFGIKAKLIKKKIPAEIIEQVLKEFYTPEEEHEVALRFLKKLQKRGRDSYEKLARSMSSKGFHTDIIRAILQEQNSL